MKEEDIKSYSLKVLEDTIEDALGSECRPDEIFNTIKLAAKRNANYHRICARDAQSLVDLLEGVDRTEKVVSINSGIKIDDVDRERFELHSEHLTDSTQWPDYTEMYDHITGLDSWRRVEDPNFIDNEKNNEENPLTYDQMIAAGYEMTGDGFWIPGHRRIEELKAKAGELDGA